MPQHNDIIFFGLSTCPYCRRAKEHLEDKHIDFKLIYVDKLEGQEKEQALDEMRKHNPAMSFPTIIVAPVNGDEPRVFIGFSEEARIFIDKLAD